MTLLLAFPVLAALLGGYLILRARAYKNEMSELNHLFGQWPVWLIRTLGVVLVVFGLGLAYLFFTRR